MRIFYASNDSANAWGLAGSRAWYYNLYLPLLDIGSDVVRFEYDLDPHFRNLDPAVPEQRDFIERERPKVEEALLFQIRKAHHARPVDLFFSYFYNAIVTPGVIREIRNLGIIAVNWYCNGAHQFELVRDIAPAYDFCLVPERFRLDDYRRIGAKPIYCQEAANPHVYRPYDLPRDYDVVFVGQCYGDRPEAMESLWEEGVEAHAWGPGWTSARPDLGGRGGNPRAWARIRERLGRLVGGRRKDRFRGRWSRFRHMPLNDEEMIRMYSRGHIVLGFSSCGDTHRERERVLQVRLRDFEVPMSGGFYIVEFMEELEEFYDIGREIVCYRDLEDLLDKVRYFLSHEREREAIRRAGHERAHREHTWQRRFENSFREMGLIR